MRPYISTEGPSNPARDFIHASRILSYDTASIPREFEHISLPTPTWQPRERLTMVVAQSALSSISTFGPRAAQCKTVFVGDIGHPELTLLSPIPVVVEPAGAQVLAYSYDLEELALADDEGAAIDEIKASIADLYFLLEREQEHLGPNPKKLWFILQRLIQRI